MPSSLVFDRESKAGYRVGKLLGGKQGKLQVCPDWMLLAWGEVEVGHCVYLVWGHIWLSHVHWRLKVEPKIREVGSDWSSPHCFGPGSAEFVVWLQGLVAAEAVGQSSIFICGLVIVPLKKITFMYGLISDHSVSNNKKRYGRPINHIKYA